jgi:hypothetical protein
MMILYGQGELAHRQAIGSLTQTACGLPTEINLIPTVRAVEVSPIGFAKLFCPCPRCWGKPFINQLKAWAEFGR